MLVYDDGRPTKNCWRLSTRRMVRQDFRCVAKREAHRVMHLRPLSRDINA
jgi:hypothetical protein